MRAVSLPLIIALMLLASRGVDAQFWKYSQQFFNPFSWIRQGKTGSTSTGAFLNTTATTSSDGIISLEPKIQAFNLATTPVPITLNATTTKRALRSSTIPVQWTTVALTTTGNNVEDPSQGTNQPQSSPILVVQANVNISTTSGGVVATSPRSTPSVATSTGNTKRPSVSLPVVPAVSGTSTVARSAVTETVPSAATATTFTWDTTTTPEVTATTEEPRGDNHRVHDFYLSKREKPHMKIASNISQNLLPLPAGASAALVKPTKYHYYPHNQHIYLLPECAIQQVCNAVYVRLNWTQPLCACPSRYRDPCSASLNVDDLHTTELMTDRNSKRALTLVKTCEPTAEMRICRAPRDWSLLALQNIRTGKSHYLVICRCPDTSILEGPMSHDQPTYASVPGIRVYGMMCVQQQATMSMGSLGGGLSNSATTAGINNKRRGRPLRIVRSADDERPPIPWERVEEIAKTANWD